MPSRPSSAARLDVGWIATDLRMAGLKARQSRHQPPHGQARQHADGQRTLGTVTPGTCSRIFHGLAQRPQSFSHLHDKDLSSVGQQHALPVANEESDTAQLLFQTADVMADGAVGETQLIGGAAVVEVPGGGFKRPQALNGR